MKRRRTLLVTEVDTGYKNQYFTIVSEADNNAIGWKTGYANSARTISISTDEGKTWTTATSTTSGVTLATLNTDDILLIKGSNTEYFDEGGSWNSPRANMFTSSGKFHVEGNIMSLIYGDDFKDQVTLTAANTFRYMFYNCSKLTTAENCIMLATTLTSSCYDRMFSNCTILTKAPTLPATTLVTGCYSYMFNGSRALNYIRCLAVDHSASNCTNNWVQNVASSGTFLKNKNASWSRGNSAVPTNWTLDDYGCGIEWSASTFTTYMNNPSNKPTFSNPNELPITFSSSDTSVATVSASGVVNIVGLGTTTLTASFAGDSEFDAETVTCVYTIAKADAGIAWSASTYSADPETSNKPTFSNPNNLSVTFTSSNTSVATISNAGVITYLAEGTTTLTASFAGDSAYNSSTVTCALTLAIDYSTHYLTIVSRKDGLSVEWGISSTDSAAERKTIYASTDNGITWVEKTSQPGGTKIASLNNGEKVLIKGLNEKYTSNYGSYYNRFFSNSMSGYFDVEGNIMSLIYGDEFVGKISFGVYCLGGLFRSSAVVNAKNLILPALTAKAYCYEKMFLGCANLISVPMLPATTIEQGCYESMFNGCTSLKEVPNDLLPATNLQVRCYSSMFSGCSALEIAPYLPATTFPSSQTVQQYYVDMFRDCTNLRYIKAMFTTTPSDDTTSNWVYKVAVTGVFVKNRNATWDVTGANGVPTGWDIIDEDQFGYIIDQRNPTAAPEDMIIKPDGASMNLSSSNDIIAWINANTKIVAAETSLSNGRLVCYETSRTDKTKYKNGNSISPMSNYDMFVKLPEFWWFCQMIATDVYLLAFSKTEVSGWNHWEGNTFIGVYKASKAGTTTKLYSKSGLSPLSNVTQSSSKNYARNRGTGYTLITYEAHCMMALLGYGWLGTTNAQSVVGRCSYGIGRTTGGRDTLGMTDTVAGGNGDNGSINFWGIENWWGDLCEFVDNLSTTGNNYGVNILNSSGSVTRTVLTYLTTSNGCIGKMMLGEYGDLLPKEIHSNSGYNNGYCDAGRIHTFSGYVFFRSSYGNNTFGGISYLQSYNYSNQGDSDTGSRLQYKGSYTLS